MRSHASGVFRNPQFYFREGVSFSNTGIYSPTFRLSHGGVFDQTGSCIFSEVLSARALLGLLASSLMRYFVKSFINHGVHAQLDDLPVVLLTADEANQLENATTKIVNALEADADFDYTSLLADLDQLVFTIYRIDEDERSEISTWFRRHYPKLVPIG
jgi:hypothetical protein